MPVVKVTHDDFMMNFPRHEDDRLFATDEGINGCFLAPLVLG